MDVRIDVGCGYWSECSTDNRADAATRVDAGCRHWSRCGGCSYWRRYGVAVNAADVGAGADGDVGTGVDVKMQVLERMLVKISQTRPKVTKSSQRCQERPKVSQSCTKRTKAKQKGKNPLEAVDRSQEAKRATLRICDAGLRKGGAG